MLPAFTINQLKEWEQNALALNFVFYLDPWHNKPLSVTADVCIKGHSNILYTGMQQRVCFVLLH